MLEAIILHGWHGELYADDTYVSEVLAQLLEHQGMSLWMPAKKAKG
jgi:hypothetical protein